MDKKKAEVIRIIRKKLNANEKILFDEMIQVQVTKNHYTFRMKLGVIALDGIWEKIKEVCESKKIVCSKANEFATLEELDNVFGDIEWLWDRYIPKGFVSMVVGDPGTGKSAVVLDFVKRVTSNLPFPLQDKKPFSKPRNVIWIDTEAGQQVLSIRSKIMEIDRSRVHIPIIDGDILSQANISDEEHREQIIALVEYAKPELLILDSLGGAHNRGENKTEDIKPVMEFFAILARDYNLAALIIHHLNKGREGESSEISLYRVRGSTVITALARSIMGLERGADDVTKMRMIKSNLAPFSSKEAITVVPTMTDDGNIKEFEYTGYVPPPPKMTKREKCAEWIIELLTENESMLMTDIVANGQLHIPSFNRQMIYDVREILGDRVTYGGTGKKSIWSLTKINNDNEAIEQIKKGVKKNGKG